MTESKYFDNAATTFPYDEVLEAYVETAKAHPANPSATHREGRDAKEVLEKCRERFASMLNVSPSTITFTSGATESISIVFSSYLQTKAPGKILLSPIEHEAVLSWASPLKAQGWTVEYLKAKGGYVDTEDLEAKLDRSVRLVAVQSVNNVTGAIEPVRELVAITRRKEKEFGRPIFFFSDSVQALGKIPFSLRELDVDGASFSAHKIKGPRGIGALYLKRPINVLSKAGGQEKGIRGGTENLPSISGFVKALELSLGEDRDRIVRLNSALRTFFKEKGIAVLSPLNASPYVLSIATPLPSEVMTRMLSDEGYCISAGSACSNNAAGKAESVIRAMGFDSKTAGGTLRLSFSPKSDLDEAMALADLIYLKAKDF